MAEPVERVTVKQPELTAVTASLRQSHQPAAEAVARLEAAHQAAQLTAVMAARVAELATLFPYQLPVLAQRIKGRQARHTTHAVRPAVEAVQPPQVQAQQPEVARRRQSLDQLSHALEAVSAVPGQATQMEQQTPETAATTT